jgi:hypothetical protein
VPAGTAPYRAAMHWLRDRAPPGFRPRVSAHSGYGRSAAASDLLNIPVAPSIRIVRSLDAHASERTLTGCRRL